MIAVLCCSVLFPLSFTPNTQQGIANPDQSDIPVHDVIAKVEGTTVSGEFYIARKESAGKAIDAKVFVAPFIANKPFDPDSGFGWQKVGTNFKCFVEDEGTSEEGAKISFSGDSPLGSNANVWVCVELRGISADDGVSEESFAAVTSPTSSGDSLNPKIKGRGGFQPKFADNVVPITLVRPFVPASDDKEHHLIFSNGSEANEFNDGNSGAFVTTLTSQPFVGSSWAVAEMQSADNVSMARYHPIHFKKKGGTAFAPYYLFVVVGETEGTAGHKEWSGVIRSHGPSRLQLQRSH